MIASLRGTVEKTVEGIILDVGGVGYGLHVTAEDFGKLADGTEAKLYVYEHIREQGFELFGFRLADTKKLFEQLLGVKNVGPRVAMAVLDIGSAAHVRDAIAAGDVQRMQAAKGVGKRAAEQIVVELRDKLGLAPSASADDVVNRPGVNVQDEAVEALVALGYSPQDAAAALQKIDVTLPTEERIKKALQGPTRASAN
ncbi:Holliday junction branch migration protein RuvA [Candidatus Saccharibacteria bacterium]|nr:MAG: Holliday junction branch migration protein RuvA [Candidatus Saccharibacteria bacterium]PID99068.1 MAG: Holliday junction branch migration protein RuvA [Candidatus Saccharibacteria bacterium]